MKLYVWKDPYPVSYGGSCLYVIADNLRKARQQIKKTHLAEYGYKDDQTSNFSSLVKGKPSRVESLPYAECYQWSE